MVVDQFDAVPVRPATDRGLRDVSGGGNGVRPSASRAHVSPSGRSARARHFLFLLVRKTRTQG